MQQILIDIVLKFDCMKETLLGNTHTQTYKSASVLYVCVSVNMCELADCNLSVSVGAFPPGFSKA